MELEVNDKSTPAENVVEALLLLDKLLYDKNKQAVLLFDEFQEVGNIAKGRGVEGAIRHAAQSTSHLTIIFSGSHPHILKNMFENDRRPLYKLCKKLLLERIDASHYRAHLDRIAEKTWGATLSEQSFELIMELTQRHPYYINALCDEIWSEYESPPDVKQVQACWDYVVESEKSDLIKDFLNLSNNQRKVARHIANYGGTDLYSKASLNQMDMQSSSLNAALINLIERDFVEKVGDNYRLIVPAYRDLLQYN